MSQDKSRIRVLVAPLDWGIGHATRCIPLIREFIGTGCEVIIGTSGKSGFLLKNYFPELQYIDIPFLKIRFGTCQVFPWYIVRLMTFPFMAIREYLFIKRYAGKLKLDLIISDNRYGLHHRDIYSVFITHQLFIRLPAPLRLFQNVLRIITLKIISGFDECWIPDLPDPDRSLSNELSHGTVSPGNYRYIGILSRFTAPAEVNSDREFTNSDLLVILSGPEPQRTFFENLVIRQCRDSNTRVIIFRGLPSKDREPRVADNITLINNPDDTDFISCIRQADKIICRSGYSTIMDLIALNRQALLVPTPGQTEQIYLARYLSSKGTFLYMSQKDFNLRDALALLEKKQASCYPGLKADSMILKEIVKNLIRRIGRQ